MKKAGLLVLSFLAFSAVAQNIPSPGQGPADSTKKCKGTIAAKMPENTGIRRGHSPNMRDEFPRDRPCLGNSRNSTGPNRNGAWQVNRARHFFVKILALKICFGLVFLGMVAFLTLNILLTVLVSLDMKNRNKFNGLWIPLLLIAGIPVSVIYALFRIGDAIQQKNG
jgi:hypothetical protein